LLPGRDPRGGVPHPAIDRARGARRGRTQPVPGRRDDLARAAGDRRRRGCPSDRKAAGAPRFSRRRGGPRGARGRGAGGAQHGEPPPGDEGSAPRTSDARRGLGRAAGRVRRIPAALAPARSVIAQRRSTVAWIIAARPATPSAAATSRFLVHIRAPRPRQASPTRSSVTLVTVTTAGQG